MTHDSSSYIVSAAPLPLSKTASLSCFSQRGDFGRLLSKCWAVSLYFIACVLVIFFWLWAAPKPLLPSSLSLSVSLPLSSLAPLHLHLAGLSSSCASLYPAVCVRGNYRSHASPEKIQESVWGTASAGGRLPEHLKLLKTSPAVVSNLHFCLNTRWVVRQKK